MINKKTFTKVLPTIPASLQFAARFGDADILFDWHKVEGFKGASIDGAQIISRSVGAFGIELLFASSNIKEVERGISVDQAPPSLGSVNGAVTTFQWKNNLTGIVEIASGDFNDNDLGALHIAGKHGLNIPVSGDLYIAAISKSNPDFRTTGPQVSTETATNTTALVVKTVSALTAFAPGDVINDQSDLDIGTVRSVTDANNIVLTKNCASVSSVDRFLYNIHPIQVMLSGSI